MAARRDIQIYQGDTFIHRLEIVDGNMTPVNVTGSTFASQIRKRASYTNVEATFAVDMTNAATGVVVLTLSPAATNGLLAGRYHYDVHQVTGGNVLTLVYGRVDVTGEVTR